MGKLCFLTSLIYCVKMLQNENVIGYPTEAIFGLGCDPNSKKAVKKLLFLKNRDINKGFILVASKYDQVKKYINEKKLSISQKKNIFLLARTFYFCTSSKF